MKNSLDTQSLIILEQVLCNKSIRLMDDERLIQFLVSEVLDLVSKNDFLESMNNEAGRRAENLTYELHISRSEQSRLYFDNERLLAEMEKLKSEADTEKLFLEQTYTNIIIKLKAQLYDEIGSRFSNYRVG